MSNTYFQFRQFTVHQEQCAMKVCTDACLFGAWVAAHIDHWQPDASNVLDIGTGTGLLTLMLAQATDGRIDAIELDEKAAAQAADNIEASPWKQQCQVIHADIRSVHLGKKYDFIISNPPFFENDLKSSRPDRNLALHSDELSLPALLETIRLYLSPSGKFAVLLPSHRKTEFENLAAELGFSPIETAMVKQTEKHSPFRVMFLFSAAASYTNTSTINIREGDRYSEAFTRLLQAYYLQL